LNSTQVREHPKYHLLLATVQRHKGDMEKAKKTLEKALGLVKSINSESSSQKGARGGANVMDFNNSDKASLYLELMAVFRALGNYEEANGLMQQALQEFKVCE